MKQVSLRVWILGLVWFVASCMGPVVMFVYDWETTWDDPIDRTMLLHQCLACGGTGVVLYWRKHRALLQLPPDLQMARELASEVKTKTITHESGVVTKTVTETHTAKETLITPPDPTATP